MLTELPMFLLTWATGLFIIFLPSLIVKLFGKEINNEEE